MVIGGGGDVSAVAVNKACDSVKGDALAGVPVCRLRPRCSLAWGLGSDLTLRPGTQVLRRMAHFIRCLDDQPGDSAHARTHQATLGTSRPQFHMHLVRPRLG